MRDREEKIDCSCLVRFIISEIKDKVVKLRMREVVRGLGSMAGRSLE